MEQLTKELIMKASQGDVGAFEVIYRTYRSYVFNVSLRMTHNKTDAEEISQEVFIRLFHKLKGFEYQSSLKTWIYRVTVNMAINYLKKEVKYKQRTVVYDETLNYGGASSQVEKKADAEYNENRISNLLNILTPEQRACVVLRNIEGFSYEEIARTLKIRINAVRSRLKRSREKLMAVKAKGVSDELS